MDDRIQKLRERYLGIKSHWNGRMWTWSENEKALGLIEWKYTNKAVEEIVKDETDINKRKEIIDYIFADEVDEVWELNLRTKYLNN